MLFDMHGNLVWVNTWEFKSLLSDGNPCLIWIINSHLDYLLFAKFDSKFNEWRCLLLLWMIINIRSSLLHWLRWQSGVWQLARWEFIRVIFKFLGSSSHFIVTWFVCSWSKFIVNGFVVISIVVIRTASSYQRCLKYRDNCISLLNERFNCILFFIFFISRL